MKLACYTIIIYGSGKIRRFRAAGILSARAHILRYVTPAMPNYKIYAGSELVLHHNHNEYVKAWGMR